MKEKLALVIAALMIASTAYALSTTTVGALPGGTATVSPSIARAGTKIKFTVTVTNGSTADNIDNVRIVATSAFTGAIGYDNNLVAAADNMDNATPYIRMAGENYRKAEDNKRSAGANFVYAAGTTSENLLSLTATYFLAENGSSAALARDNATINIFNAAGYLKLVGLAIDNLVENLVYIQTNLNLAGAYLRQAAGSSKDNALSQKENIDNICDAAAENIDNAGYELRQAATYIAYGDFENAGLQVKMAGDNLWGAGTYAFTNTSLRTIFINAGSMLQTAGLKLKDAGDFLDNADNALDVAGDYLRSAGTLLASVSAFSTTGANLLTVGNMIENAARTLTGGLDNQQLRGENLRRAADNLASVAADLGVALGSDNENAAAIHIRQAAENLKYNDRLSLTTAGNELKNAADDLDAGALVMKTTALSLSPITWSIDTTTYPIPPAGTVQFSASGDNIIAPNGGTQTFVFLWTTPSIITETNYMLSVLVSKEEPVYTSFENLGGFTLKVDGLKPTLTIKVTQAEVGIPNVVGNKLDNGRATITIVASEPLSYIENVRVENSGQYENLLPPIPGSALTTTDNITWTYYPITIGAWDDNSVAVRVTKITDLAGNDNTAGMENIIRVDTKAPLFVPTENSGLTTLVSSMRTNVTQAGTGTVYRYVDNGTLYNMVIRVEDNYRGTTDNAKWVTSVTVDNSPATRDPTVDNRWVMANLTLSAGYHTSVKVTARDLVGNENTDNMDNIFVDTAAPTIAFNTITRTTGAVSWTENGLLINDNTPEITLTITDLGYPTTGLGVAYENLFVYLDNDDNINNGFGTGAAPYGKLENKGAWDPSIGVFDNLIDNAGKGLVSGTYWIIVRANDNLRHAGDNENWVIAKQSFTLDVTKPVKDTDIVVSDKIGGTVDDPNVYKTATRTIEGTVTSGEVGGTIKVYFNGVHKSEYNLVTTATSWSITVTLPAGQTTKIEFTLTDRATNESDKVLYGYAMADATAPTVMITAPVEGATTDKVTTMVEATITGDNWEAGKTVTVRLDATSLTAPLEADYVLGSDYKYNLKRAVTLVEGVNTISVSAKDAAGNWSAVKTVTVTRTVTPWATYAIIIVIVALILAAIAIFRKK